MKDEKATRPNADWRDELTRLLRIGADRLDDTIDRWRHGFRKRWHRLSSLQVVAYRGFGREGDISLTARVLEEPPFQSVAADSAWWENILTMYHRLESDEVPGAEVRVRFAGEEQTVIADKEGYARVRIDAHAPGLSAGWHDVTWELVRPIPADQQEREFPGKVLIPSATARFGVISDIDDTVLRTGATHKLRMARQTFLYNAHQRLPFEGVAAFYRALHRGPQAADDEGPGEQNPFFYVSSSPWNLYDLLVDFFRLQGLPKGPFLLRDLGIDEAKFGAGDHSHKLEKIRRILTCCPDIPFLLIGDSGQQDPYIYRQVVQQYPERVAAIYIRDVSDANRDDVTALAEQVSGTGIDMLLVEDTAAAAAHAAQQGWIDPSHLVEIGIDRAKDAGELPEEPAESS